MANYKTESILVLNQARNIHKQRARISGNVAMSQTSYVNPYLIDSIQEAFTIYFNMFVINLHYLTGTNKWGVMV